MPALAVAEELRTDGHQVVFVGGDRDESKLVPQAGFDFKQIQVKGFSRTNKRDALKTVPVALRAISEARKIVSDVQPDAVMGGGGYMAGVAGLAALTNRVPLVLTEADGHLGISNRSLRRFADRLCLGFPVKGLTPPKYLVTGRPVSPAWTDIAAAREYFGVPQEALCVLVFGGSLGALSVNNAAIKGLDSLTVNGRPVFVIHSTGQRDHAEMLNHQVGPNYKLCDYISPLSRAMAASDLIVARAGGSIAEITLHGRPSILVPYPFASGDHQNANADWLVEAGAAIKILDADLDHRLLRATVEELLADSVRLELMASNSLAVAKPNAAREIADQMLAVAN